MEELDTLASLPGLLDRLFPEQDGEEATAGHATDLGGGADRAGGDSPPRPTQPDFGVGGVDAASSADVDEDQGHIADGDPNKLLATFKFGLLVESCQQQSKLWPLGGVAAVSTLKIERSPFHVKVFAKGMVQHFVEPTQRQGVPGVGDVPVVPRPFNDCNQEILDSALESQRAGPNFEAAERESGSS